MAYIAKTVSLREVHAHKPGGWARVTLARALQPLSCIVCGSTIAVGESAVRFSPKPSAGQRQQGFACNRCMPFHETPLPSHYYYGSRVRKWLPEHFREDCPVCQSERTEQERDMRLHPEKPCPHCGGTGVIEDEAAEEDDGSLHVLPPNVRAALWRNGVTSVEAAQAASDERLLAFRNFGKSKLATLRQHFPHVPPEGGET